MSADRKAFFEELVAALDALPEKQLGRGRLITEWGYCSLGAMCLRQGLHKEDVRRLSTYEARALTGVSKHVATLIIRANDSEGPKGETPEARFTRMRAWAVEQAEADT